MRSPTAPRAVASSSVAGGAARWSASRSATTAKALRRKIWTRCSRRFPGSTTAAPRVSGSASSSCGMPPPFSAISSRRVRRSAGVPVLPSSPKRRCDRVGKSMSGPKDTKDTVIERVRLREVAGVFRTPERLEGAIDALLLSGFDRADIDTSSGEEALREHFGETAIPAEELAEVPGAPRQPFYAREDVIAPVLIPAAIAAFVVAAIAAYLVIAAGGGAGSAAIAAALAAAGAGAAGAMTVRRAQRRHLDRLQRRSRAAGLVLWVRARSPDEEEKAARILRDKGGEAVRIHEIEIAKRAEDLPLARLRIDPWLSDEPLGQPCRRRQGGARRIGRDDAPSARALRRRRADPCRPRYSRRSKTPSTRSHSSLRGFFKPGTTSLKARASARPRPPATAGRCARASSPMARSSGGSVARPSRIGRSSMSSSMAANS